jgi:tetratricopeptide (TPR) repeat protein
MRRLLVTCCLLALAAGAAIAAPSPSKDRTECIDNYGGGDPETGIPACTRLLRSATGSERVRVLMMRAAWYSRAEKHDQIIADYREVLRIAPAGSKEAKESEYFLAGAHKDKGDRATALAVITEYIGRYPEDAEGYQFRALLHADMRNYDQAIADIDAKIRLGKRGADNYLLRAGFWKDKGDRARAIADYDLVIKLAPRNTFAYESRAEMHEAAGDLKSALADYRKSMAIDPQTGRDSGVGRHITRLERKIASAPPAPPVLAQTPVPPPVTVPPPVIAQPREPAPVAAPVPAPTPAPVIVQKTEPPATVAALPPAPTPVAAPPPAERRIALVIGNSAYANAAALLNPKNDAGLIAAALKQAAFARVDLHLDLARDRMIDALKAFAAEADKADWAVVYFAGHGLEIGGVNYLIPTDAKLASDRDIPFEAVALENVLHAVAGSRKLKLVVLDACRDNPFARTMTRSLAATRSLGRGLAQVEPEGATLVAYAAKHGQVAQDGDGANSPFARAFAKSIGERGLEISMLMRKVRDDVLDATGRRQEPFVYGSLPSQAFYFRAP